MTIKITPNKLPQQPTIKEAAKGGLAGALVALTHLAAYSATYHSHIPSLKMGKALAAGALVCANGDIINNLFKDTTINANGVVSGGIAGMIVTTINVYTHNILNKPNLPPLPIKTAAPVVVLGAALGSSICFIEAVMKKLSKL